MVHFYSRIIFIFGFTVGVLLAIIYRKYTNPNISLETDRVYQKDILSYNNYQSWFKSKGLRRKEILWDTLRYTNRNYFLESQFLFERIKVLCIILVKNIKNANASSQTWARGCTKIRLIHLNSNKGIVVKRSKEQSSWVLLCQDLNEIYYNKYDWILVVNDNSFVIMENLRYYVANMDANGKHYLGHAVKFWSTTYNSGQAGYVLSRGALSAFKKKVGTSECLSSSYWNREDFYLGKYLAALNITPTDTRDTKGFSRFHPYNWHHAFFPGESYNKASVFPLKCCSKYSISFQAIEGDKMFFYYYLLYSLQIFLSGQLGNKPPINVPDEEVWKKFLRERNVQSDNISSDHYYKAWIDLIDDPKSFARNVKRESFDYD